MLNYYIKIWIKIKVSLKNDFNISMQFLLGGIY